jgi:FMN phosphatase YigB (HAD superfamily)
MMTDQIQAVLFDLDGTLLANDMNVFLPHYFERLTARVAHLVAPGEFLARLRAATDRMLANDGQATNQEVFNEAFYPVAGHSREELEPILLEFYTQDFPVLQRYTRRKPEARRVVQRAFDLGYDVVVATNPLFPAIATQQRLEWAGVADFPYRLVTSYENSRATKPSLRYFEEILETIGQSPVASLMVGDEDMDMAAGRLGCATFLVRGPRTDLSPTTPSPTYQGTLADLEPLLARLRS